MASIISMLTDFGTADGYAGAMKGVILSRNPRVTIVDITHAVTPQDVAAASYVLDCVWRFFPEGSVHLAVVDPGVGTARKPLIVEHEKAIFIAPDNGLLTPVLNGPGVRAVREIANPDLQLPVVSRTFHGRDVFAPAAAHAAGGVPVHDFGPPVAEPCRNAIWECEITPRGIAGRVVHLDRFGNAVTNIRAAKLEGRRVARIQSGRLELDRIHATYGDVAPGEALALIGSQGTLELAVRGGSFAERQPVEVGSGVTVEFAR